MNKNKWHRFIWRLINRPVTGYFRLWLCYKTKSYTLPGPSMVISNHTTNYDPLLVAASFPKHQMYFVASEHLMRSPFWGKLVGYLSSKAVLLICGIGYAVGHTEAVLAA